MCTYIHSTVYAIARRILLNHQRSVGCAYTQFTTALPVCPISGTEHLVAAVHTPLLIHDIS